MSGQRVTAYYLCHGYWTVIPHQLAENFKDMRDCGFNAVAFSFSESEMFYARRAFEIQIALAKKEGLKCFVIPSRLGGRLAGAPLMPGRWITMHPESQVPGYQGFSQPIACLENRAFRDWVKEFMAVLLKDYPLDGIIWDEPKVEREISTHPDTVAKYGPSPTPEQMEDGFVDFLQDITSFCRTLNSNLEITIFNQKTSSERFSRASAAVKGIDYAGFDGNLAPQSYFHEEPKWLKYRIESVWDRTVEECRATGKKTFALVENMLMPSTAIPEYERNLEAYLKTCKPDHLSLYYYAHNNEDPESVHRITRALMKKFL